MRKVLMIIAGLMACFSVAAQVTPGTACGEAGAGYVHGPTGNKVLQMRTAEQAASSSPNGTRVAADGYWTVCEAPVVKDPIPCLGTGGFKTWDVGSNSCTSELRDATSATHPARDTGIEDGKDKIWRQWTGPMRGHHWVSCKAGKPTIISSVCAPATHCDTAWSWRGYSYRGAPVPIGGSVKLTKPGGMAMTLACSQGATWKVQ